MQPRISPAGCRHIMRFVDLHTHSSCSDGTTSPAEVVRAASAVKVEAVVLSDHDTTCGCRGAWEEAVRLNLRFCPGVEISTNLHDNLHILGYGIREDDSLLQQRLESYRGKRAGRVKKITELLAAAGLDISFEEIRPEPGRSVGRPHVADLLKRKGLAHSRQDAFRKYLVQGRSGYVPPAGPSVEEAIAAVRESGGLAVLAHPGVVMDVLDIPAWRGAGLSGIEAYYPAHSVSLTRKLLEIASENSLLVTGGTDYHGPGSGREESIGIEIPDDDFSKIEKKLFG